MGIEEQEAEKYRKVYEHGGIYRGGPGVSHVPTAIEKLGCKSGDSIIDFGCGGGETCISFQDHGMEVLGTDIADCLESDFKHYVPFIKSALWILNGYFPVADFAFSSHVLEHVPPEKVDDSLKAIERHTAKAAYLDIFHLPDSCGQWVGEKLHLTVKPSEWWRERIAQFFTITEEITIPSKATGEIKETSYVCLPKNPKQKTTMPKVTRPKSNESVVIIGHGPSGVNSGFGEQIDSHDNVIRFTWRRQQPPEDYGTKVDYIVTSLRNHADIINEGTMPSKGVWLFGRPGQVDLKMALYLKNIRLAGYPVCFGREVWPWHFKYRDLGATGYIDPRQGEPGLIPSFSQGTGAIVMACCRINPRRINLIGFDNVWAGKSDGYLDWNSMKRGEPPRKSGHDLRVERILIDELMNHFDVEIGPLNEKTKDSVL